MKKWLLALTALILFSLGLFEYVSRGTHPQESGTGVEAAHPTRLTTGGGGDLLVADDYHVFSVDSKSGGSERILDTDGPISSISYSADHTVVTVYNPNDQTSFRGLYIQDKQSKSFTPYPTPQWAPGRSYAFGDLLFVASADRTVQQGNEMTKVGIFQLKEHRWVKEWLVPGGVEDVEGAGKDVYFVTSNNASTSSNIYKADLVTGEWGKLIQEARRYPLDQVSVDTNGDIYMMISQRHKSEWSNKIYKFNSQQVPYELANNFVSNTKPYSYSMEALQGKMLINRYDVSHKTVDLEKPLALLDLKSRKQVQLAWDHRPVDVAAMGDRFAVLGEDGTVAIVATDASEQPSRQFQIEELTEARTICAKK